MACAHKFLFSSVNNIIHISALHEQPHFAHFHTLPELQTKENLSNRNKTQPEKLSHDEKKIENKLPQLHQKNINLYIKVFLNFIYFNWRKLIANHNIFFNYFYINSSSLYFISRGGILLSRSITILRNIKTALLVVPSSPLMHVWGWYSSRPAREEKSQT